MGMQPIVFKVKDRAYLTHVLAHTIPLIRALSSTLADTSVKRNRQGDIEVRAPLFQESDQSDQESSIKALLWLLETLTLVNQHYLANNPHAPKIYEAGVKYVPEFGTENWQDIPTTLELGYGDCEDLSAWVDAERRSEGMFAKPYLRWTENNGSYRFHALSLLPTGYIEDPSLRLGMADWSDFLRKTA